MMKELKIFLFAVLLVVIGMFTGILLDILYSEYQVAKYGADMIEVVQNGD